MKQSFACRYCQQPCWKGCVMITFLNGFTRTVFPKSFLWTTFESSFTRQVNGNNILQAWLIFSLKNQSRNIFKVLFSECKNVFLYLLTELVCSLNNSLPFSACLLPRSIFLLLILSCRVLFASLLT